MLQKNKIPSPTELVLIKALWEKSPMSAREVHNSILEKLQWSYSSTRKTLDRMQEKGYLKSEKAHGMKIYHPVVDKVTTLAQFISDLSQRILEVECPLPVNMFAHSKLLNESEINELEDIINAKFDQYD